MYSARNSYADIFGFVDAESCFCVRLRRVQLIKFSDFTPKITGAPLLGEHTDEVLKQLGYSAEQIARMHSDKIV